MKVLFRYSRKGYQSKERTERVEIDHIAHLHREIAFRTPPPVGGEYVKWQVEAKTDDKTESPYLLLTKFVEDWG